MPSAEGLYWHGERGAISMPCRMKLGHPDHPIPGGKPIAMKSLYYSIVVDETHLTQTNSIAEAASARGFEVRQVVSEIGAIFGCADQATLERLQQIPGVEEIRPCEDIQLPTFDPSTPQ